MLFFKLYTPPKGSVPRKTISVFYRGIPLYSAASFESDRYVFNFPLNLRDKMTTGNMYADLEFCSKEKGGNVAACAFGHSWPNESVRYPARG